MSKNAPYLTRRTRTFVKSLAKRVGLQIVEKKPDFYLHEYASYEEYKAVQVFHNKRKIDKIWADERTLSLVSDRIKKEFKKKKVQGLCHGARNGFEQNFLSQQLQASVLGTDISDNAEEFDNSVEWDFHDQRDDWVDNFDFIYTNSLDQSWQPKAALTVWLAQLKKNGLLFIEHTDAHDAQHAGEMDPFGVSPKFMPFVLSDWFGHNISIEIIESTKPLNDLAVFLFVIKKTAD